MSNSHRLLRCLLQLPAYCMRTILRVKRSLAGQPEIYRRMIMSENVHWEPALQYKGLPNTELNFLNGLSSNGAGEEVKVDTRPGISTKKRREAQFVGEN